LKACKIIIPTDLDDKEESRWAEELLRKRDSFLASLTDDPYITERLMFAQELSELTHEMVCTVMFTQMAQLELKGTFDYAEPFTLASFAGLISKVMANWNPEAILYERFASIEFMVQLCELWKSPAISERALVTDVLQSIVQSLHKNEHKTLNLYEKSLLSQVGSLLDNPTTSGGSTLDPDQIFRMIGTCIKTFDVSHLIHFACEYLMSTFRSSKKMALYKDEAREAIIRIGERAKRAGDFKEGLILVTERLVSICLHYKNAVVEGNILEAMRDWMVSELAPRRFHQEIFGCIYAIVDETEHLNSKEQILELFLDQRLPKIFLLGLYKDGQSYIQKIVFPFYVKLMKWIELESTSSKFFRKLAEIYRFWGRQQSGFMAIVKSLFSEEQKVLSETIRKKLSEAEILLNFKDLTVSKSTSTIKVTIIH
jgi:hypothetical protein